MIGICQTAFTQIRPEPKHSAELISQLVLGELVLISDMIDDWCKIETEHGYQGFARTGQLRVISKAEALNLISEGMLISTKSGVDPRFPESIHQLPAGIFHFSFENRNSQNLVSEEFAWKNISNPVSFSPDKIEKLCQSALGIPYVWGGKNYSGLDCSGLVQSLFQQLGYSFPRDAWQQAEIGETIDFDKNKPEFLPGDLLFFQRPGKQIHHVAISSGGGLYFHASEWTRKNSLDLENELFVQDRFDTLVLAKRIAKKHLTSLKDSFTALIQKDI